MLLQAIEASRTVWPRGTTPGALVWVAVALAVAGPLLLLQARKYYVRLRTRETVWIALLRHAINRGLTAAQIRQLRSFFASRGEAQIEKLLHDREIYRAQLLDYLRSVQGAGRSAVRMFDTLFPDTRAPPRIASAGDLQVGELCSMELAKSTHLGVVTQVIGADVILSVPRRSSGGEEIRPGEAAKLYAYRIGAGGFELSGNVVRADRHGVIYRYAGRVEAKGAQHLMASLEMPCVLLAWPRKTTDVTRLRKGSTSAASVLNLPGGIQCKTVQISDRGMTFVARSTGHSLLQKQKVWEVRLPLGGGYNFVCRGFVSPSRAGNGRFLMKFVDVHEAARRVLLATIKSHAPVPEHLV